MESSHTITEKGGYAQLVEQSAVAMKYLYLILVSASNQIFFLNEYELKKLLTFSNVLCCISLKGKGYPIYSK